MHHPAHDEGAAAPRPKTFSMERLTTIGWAHIMTLRDRKNGNPEQRTGPEDRSR